MEALKPDYSVIVPCYNESEVIPVFHERLKAVMNQIGRSWEVVYVNDGSKDQTLSIIKTLAKQDQHIAFLNLSRNFGKEIAMTAGLDHARCIEGVIIIDADLQDPPEVILKLIETWNEKKVDIVYAMRRERLGESWLKRATAHGFYKLMQKIGGNVVLPPDTGDFRFLSRRALNALLQLREHHRFMKGLFAWIGFPSEAVLYDRAPRIGGKSSFSYWSLWNFALEGITSFTVLPLRMATYIGLVVALFSLFYGGIIIFRTLVYGNPVHGYPSLMTVILFLGGVQLMTMGVIGEYLGRIFNETKQRPLYLIEDYHTSEIG